MMARATGTGPASSTGAGFVDRSSPRVDSAGGRIVSWGEVLWDLYPDEARLGGAPANVAYHLARMGRPTALISRVGDDRAGRDARARLAAAGVDTGAVQVDRDGRPTGTVDVAIERGEARYTLQPDCAWEHIAFDAAARAAVTGAAALCFGTLALRRGRAALAALDAALDALPADALVACDPNLRGEADDPALAGWLLSRVDILKVNEGELATLGRLLERAEPLAYLVDCGIVVAVTRGARGCSIHRGGEVARHPGFPVAPGGDSVGCGDAFAAVLLDLLVAGAELDHIATAACRYAAFVASRRGATPDPDRDLLVELAALAPAPSV
jgi:fructokinase